LAHTQGFMGFPPLSGEMRDQRVSVPGPTDPFLDPHYIGEESGNPRDRGAPGFHSLAPASLSLSLLIIKFSERKAKIIERLALPVPPFILKIFPSRPPFFPFSGGLTRVDSKLPSPFPMLFKCLCALRRPLRIIPWSGVVGPPRFSDFVVRAYLI